MHIYKISRQSGCLYSYGAYKMYGALTLTYKFKSRFCVQQQQISGFYKTRISFQSHSFYCRKHKYTLECPFSPHKVVAFALLRLKGVACETTHQLQHMLNRCLFFLLVPIIPSLRYRRKLTVEGTTDSFFALSSSCNLI